MNGKRIRGAIARRDPERREALVAHVLEALPNVVAREPEHAAAQEIVGEREQHAIVLSSITTTALRIGVDGSGSSACASARPPW
jgi:hypothetical protein